MCAMIPILRVSSSLNARPIALISTPKLFLYPRRLLPAIMRKSLIRLGHAMHVFLFLDGATTRVSRINQFICELVGHRLASAFPRILQQPTNRQRLPPEGIHFHRNLVVRAAHAPCLHFQHRFHVFDGLLDNLQRFVIGLLGHLIHRAVKHPLRSRFLAVPHHRADKLLHQIAGEYRVNSLLPSADKSLAWHRALSLLILCFVSSLNSRRLLLSRFGPLGPVLRSPLFTVLDSRRVQRSPHDVVSHSWQILNAAAAHQYDGVLL